MEKKNKKITIKYYSRLRMFLSNDYVRVVILIILLLLTVVSGKFPYVNLIANHYFYGIGVVMVLATIFFKEHLNERINKIIVIFEVIIAVIIKIFGNPTLEDFVGFILFFTLLLMVLLSLVSERSKLTSYLSK